MPWQTHEKLQIKFAGLSSESLLKLQNLANDLAG